LAQVENPVSLAAIGTEGQRMAVTDCVPTEKKLAQVETGRGEQFWLTALRAGCLSPAQVTEGFLGSAESFGRAASC